MAMLHVLVVGHLFAAAGLFDSAIGLEACRSRVVPGISTLEQLADSCAGLNVTRYRID
jgi:3-oxoacyl-(acyl-carrier-protein) synthase